VEQRVESDALVVSTAELVAIEENALAIAEETYQPGAPQLKVQRDRRDSVYAKLTAAKGTARKTAIGTALESARADLGLAESLAGDAAELAAVRQKHVDELEARSLEMMQAQTQLDEWEREADEMQQFLSSTVGAITRIDVESNAPASVEVAAQPYAPKRPSHRTQLQAVVALLALSVGAGVCAGFLREMTDQQINSPQDLSYLTQMPLLAVVPHTRYDQLPQDVRLATVMHSHPASTTADEYRRVLSRIVYPPAGSAELNSVLITGSSRGDGKTTVACNIAIALAQANRKVLALDICARRPSVERSFGLEPGPGLADIFDGAATLDTAVRSTGVAGLDVLGPGAGKGFVAGRYASRELVQLLEQAEATYDHVIIDSPPALLMADAGMLAPVVDGVIVVTGAGVSSQGMVKRCLQELAQAGANVVGLILTRAKPVPGGYMESNLQSYYGYGEARSHENAAKAPENATMLLVDEPESGKNSEP
jgi:capsular exopolysaccharide synthesis family protein